MAVILKSPIGRSKGIIVFTHKERALLDLEAPLLGPELKKLRDQYVVAMHWGWHQPEPIEHNPAVDIEISRESVVRFRGGDRCRIPLNSANFTPAFFSPRPVPKQWDLISVTRPLKPKRTDQLLDFLRIVYDRRPDTSALVICAGPRNPSKMFHRNLWERYQTEFSQAERERFTFLYSEGIGYPFPFPRRDIAFFYNASRVFTLFSDVEGQSKVIKEALLCGVPVLVKAHLEGGGREFLDSRNSRTFTEPRDGADALIDMLEHYETFRVDTTNLQRDLSELASVPLFVGALRDYFTDHGIPFEGEVDTENLSQKLPSHAETIPRALCNGWTSDLSSPQAMLRYFRMINGNLPVDATTLTTQERTTLRLMEVKLSGLRLAKRVNRRLRKVTHE